MWIDADGTRVEEMVQAADLAFWSSTAR